MASGSDASPRAAGSEAAVDARRPIIDAHHHLWKAGDGLTGPEAYLYEDLAAEFGDHNIIGTVFVESGARPESRHAHQPVEHTAFAAEQARRSASSRAPILAIVAFADLTEGDAVQESLDAHAAAGEGLFRGVRQGAAYMPEMNLGRPQRDLLAEPAFRQGVRRLGRGGYSFDAFVFYPQLAELARLADETPETTFILNHLGMPVWRGQGDRASVTGPWREGLRQAAKCPNLVLKIGGVGMDTMFGMGWSGRPQRPGADEIVDWWGDDIRFCIDTLGPARCMFESNFPVDGWVVGYTALWNAFQKIAAAYDDAEQEAMFSGTARRAYRLRGAESLEAIRPLYRSSRA